MAETESPLQDESQIAMSYVRHQLSNGTVSPFILADLGTLPHHKHDP